MLSAALVIAALAQNSNGPPAADFPPAHLEWTIQPMKRQIRTEWICAKGAPATSATIEVEDIGEDTRNAYFKPKLLSLRVLGKVASKASVERVKTALSGINNLHDFEASCRDKSPVLEIRGSFYDGKKDSRRSFVVDLEPASL